MVTARAIHLCIDMQRLFAPDGPWPTPWLPRVAPVVARIAAHAPQRTIFTAFTPPHHPAQMPGAWQRYYERWRHVTRAHLAPEMLELVPELARFVPPAEILAKTRYSAFAETDLAARLRARGADSVIITGAETDVCVLATVLDAIDLGFPVVLVTDAVCSVSDEGHDSLVDLYQQRFSEQIEAIDSARLLRAWTPDLSAPT